MCKHKHGTPRPVWLWSNVFVNNAPTAIPSRVGWPLPTPERGPLLCAATGKHCYDQSVSHGAEYPAGGGGLAALPKSRPRRMQLKALRTLPIYFPKTLPHIISRKSPDSFKRKSSKDLRNISYPETNDLPWKLTKRIEYRLKVYLASKRFLRKINPSLKIAKSGLLYFLTLPSSNFFLN